MKCELGTVEERVEHEREQERARARAVLATVVYWRQELECLMQKTRHDRLGREIWRSEVSEVFHELPGATTRQFIKFFCGRRTVRMVRLLLLAATLQCASNYHLPAAAPPRQV